MRSRRRKRGVKKEERRGRRREVEGGRVIEAR